MKSLRLVSLAAVAVVTLGSTSTVSSTTTPSTPPPLSLPSLPPLPALPPLDLSPEGLDRFLKDLLSAVGSHPLLPNLEKPLSGLFKLLSDLLKAAEGLLLPPKAQEEAHQLTDSLRTVFFQQSLVKEKLSALQALFEQGGLAPLEQQSLKDIAKRLWEQYKELEAFGRSLLKKLADLLKTVFPQIKPSLPSSPEDTPQTDFDDITQTARSLFPDLLN